MSDDNGAVPISIKTPSEILKIGLKLVCFSEGRTHRAGIQSNIARFKKHCGCNPSVAARMFEDLQATDLPAARLGKNKVSCFCFSQSLNFLHVCETEERREPIFDRSPKTLRKWLWYYVKKLAALKQLKIKWPDDFPHDDEWVISVDCTDCPIEEITTHPTLSQDSELYSFKLNGAGFRCEYGIDRFYSNVLWVNGPFLPGKYNDNQIFADFGLKERLSSCGKKALADKIYNGHPNECSTFNAVDNSVIRTFKARTQMSHEQFNGMVKEFGCCKKPFRHKPDKMQKHKWCFEAVTVICQYRLEHGEPLFDLLAGL